MKRIISTNESETRLGDIIVPAAGGVEVTDDKLQALMMRNASFRARLASGDLAIVEITPTGPTRGDIARMNRTDLLDILAAHGVAESDVEGRFVPELRELAAQVVFVEG